jgi:hypothetical protein
MSREILIRELSVTPVGYFTGAICKSFLWGVPRRLFCMTKMRYFRETGMIFLRLPLLQMEFDGIWGIILQFEVNKMV